MLLDTRWKDIMNKKEKQWIKENIERIFIQDVLEDNDSQIEHTQEFLAELAGYVGARLVPEEKC